MALETKLGCGKCGGAIAAVDRAFICSFECTFCAKCPEHMQHICPNCGGELVRRPRRKPSATAV
jgi:uncharacterized protein